MPTVHTCHVRRTDGVVGQPAADSSDPESNTHRPSGTVETPAPDAGLRRHLIRERKTISLQQFWIAVGGMEVAPRLRSSCSATSGDSLLA